METILWGLQFLLLVLFLASLLGGPMVLVDWVRKRRREAVMQQIALTDAIYAQFGSIASPVVKRPLWGPRQIEFQVEPGGVAKVLVAAHEVLSAAERMNLHRYQIVITPSQVPVLEEENVPAHQSTARWHGDTIVATR
ncbi:MAG TPA: hypothetical protein VLH58_12340 [Candidatus Methylomirabilis sp.]|nr:hypothetical protein [Candidatus Methylomirabilis sp.]HSC72138.1 hypothetical protein [Candidatus Methylomirabilis sp.]